MDAVIEKPVFRGASTGEPVSRLTRTEQDIRASLAEEPSWFRQINVSLPPYEDEVAVFQQNLDAHCTVNRHREAIAEALDYFDDRLIAGHFRDCDRALRQLQVAKLASSVMVSILGITIRAKTLKGRAIFFERAFQEIARRKGKKYASELLAKYR